MPGRATRRTAVTVPSCLIRAIVPLPRFATYKSESRASVVLLEKDIGERRPAYRRYIEETNAFLPGPPKPAASGPGSSASGDTA